ncbi:MAG: DNA-formamidopyrimidine glycosylase [Candidatus Caldatribacteriota bacterium]
MPELPEVETIRRELENKIKGKIIKEVSIGEAEKIIQRPAPAQFIAQLKDKKIMGLNRRGKYLIICLDSAGRLILHLGMTGVIIYPYDDKTIQLKGINPKHNHLSLVFTDHTQLVFNDVRRFGKLYLISNLEEVESIDKLGIEPLDDNFTLKAFKKILYSKKKSKIKSFLMNQTFITGLGNIYANEVLFRANIHPLRLILSLTEREIERLYQEIKTVLTIAIQCGGSTVADEAFRNTNGEKGSFAEKIQVYARQGEPCKKCGQPIEVIRIEGRSSFFCPRCQKL